MPTNRVGGEHDDIGDLTPAGTHGGKGRVTVRIDEGGRNLLVDGRRM